MCHHTAAAATAVLQAYSPSHIVRKGMHNVDSLLVGYLSGVYKKRREFFATHAKEEEHFVQHSRISIYFYLIIIPSL